MYICTHSESTGGGLPETVGNGLLESVPACLLGQEGPWAACAAAFVYFLYFHHAAFKISISCLSCWFSCSTLLSLRFRSSISSSWVSTLRAVITAAARAVAP